MSAIANRFFNGFPAYIVAATDDFALLFGAHLTIVMPCDAKGYGGQAKSAVRYIALISPGESCKTSVLLTTEKKWPLILLINFP
ncbi:hypothetical protein AZI85_08965 [Bdellovibrio bacteriovorus]|uniref:Uncharacterized protein n=1 Tax=Bdellovibrio bacteriovorus TaxID=959 RepID=A0A150WDS7_BDEBC|nr:hypothetical protein AZI85_08965 [Bdellovibrio bacteriovorus]